MNLIQASERLVHPDSPLKGVGTAKDIQERLRNVDFSSTDTPSYPKLPDDGPPTFEFIPDIMGNLKVTSPHLFTFLYLTSTQPTTGDILARTAILTPVMADCLTLSRTGYKVKTLSNVAMFKEMVSPPSSHLCHVTLKGSQLVAYLAGLDVLQVPSKWGKAKRPYTLHCEERTLTGALHHLFRRLETQDPSLQPLRFPVLDEHEQQWILPPKLTDTSANLACRKVCAPQIPTALS